MDSRDVAQRLSRLEELIDRLSERLARLDNHTVRVTENLCVENLKVDQRVSALEARINNDFRDVERIAQEAYLRTTPQAQAGLYEVIDAVSNARRHGSKP